MQTSTKQPESDKDKAPPNIVRPSSLNYKISLLEAVNSFTSKDRTAEQQVEVELEEPTNKNRINFDALDDALFNITRATVLQAQHSQKMQNQGGQKGKAQGQGQATQKTTDQGN